MTPDLSDPLANYIDVLPVTLASPRQARGTAAANGSAALVFRANGEVMACRLWSRLAADATQEHVVAALEVGRGGGVPGDLRERCHMGVFGAGHQPDPFSRCLGLGVACAARQWSRVLGLRAAHDEAEHGAERGQQFVLAQPGPAERLDQGVRGRVARRRTAGADWRISLYGGTAHGFTNRAADSRGMDGVAYHEQAYRRSWGEMVGLFDEIFAASA